MIALLMLGIIPGTDIQIDFISWLMVIGALFVSMLLYIAFKKKIQTIFTQIHHFSQHPKIPIPQP
ncbi:MAG: hypothetical protein ACREF5_02295 [Candidatus Saccharimonadales bacterium]